MQDDLTIKVKALNDILIWPSVTPDPEGRHVISDGLISARRRHRGEHAHVTTSHQALERRGLTRNVVFTHQPLPITRHEAEK
jgi:hypothetical protein